jgi:steroid delta-isomerase-like uncharacterized protein
MEANKALVRRFYEEIFNQKNMDALDALLPSDAVDHALPPGMPAGREGVRQFIGMYLTAFPDMRVTLEDLLAEGDKVVVRTTYRGTHQAELMGIPATGKQVTVTSIEILRCAGDQLAEHWAAVDQLGMLQQLGVIPPPGQAG